MDILIAQLLVNGIITGSFFALCGVTWGIIYRTAKTFHFSHHLVFTVAGYGAVLLVGQLGVHYLFGAPAAVAAAIVFGCAVEALLYRTLRRRGANRETIFLSSLGFATAGVAILLLIFSSTPLTLKGFHPGVLALGPTNFTDIDVATVIVSWLAVGGLLLFLKKSRYGRAIRAVGVNPEMSANVGLDKNKMYLLVYAIGSGLFGLAAFLYSAKNAVVPTMGIFPFFMAFTAVFLGGINSIAGHALAGFILGFAENIAVIVLPGEYRVMVAYAILVVVIIFRPSGLIGGKRG